MTGFWTDWTFEPGVVIPLALVAALYIKGWARRPAPRDLLFWTGWGVLLLSQVSPLHRASEELFSAHMTQHEILMLVAAPLLVLSRPMAPILRGLPQAWRRRAARLMATPSPFAAWLIQAVVLWTWHAPPLFQATLRNDWIHAAQHACFLYAALIFWESLRKAGYGAGVLYIFTTSVHTSILGALLTFSPRLWYPAYAATAPRWGLAALEDQQIGGLIMWVPAGAVYMIVGLVMFALWFQQMPPERRAILGPSVTGAVLLAAMLSGCGTGLEMRSAAEVTGGDARRGAAAIGHYGCGSCHTIRGISGANGLVGPPLTGIGQRMYVAGVLTNSPDNASRWIQDPKAVDEKTAMPKLGVTPQDARDIVAYLYSTR